MSEKTTKYLFDKLLNKNYISIKTIFLDKCISSIGFHLIFYWNPTKQNNFFFTLNKNIVGSWDGAD